MSATQRLVAGACFAVCMILTAQPGRPEEAALDVRATDFVTSPSLESDKLASIWLMRRLGGESTRFHFLPPDQHPATGIPFDTPRSEYRRKSDLACYETILLKWKVSDAILLRIGQLIHDVEINYWGEQRYEQSVILDQKLQDAIRREAGDPRRCIEAAARILDALYKQLSAGGLSMAQTNSVPRLRFVAPGLYTSGQPIGDDGFARLRRLGIRTAISVDGLEPPVDQARRHGIRYVHVPLGYTDIPRSKATQIIKAVDSFGGPALIHCHRGLHRAPFAAAVVGMALHEWSADSATSWMKTSGTSTQYKRLYGFVREFDPPAASELEALEVDLPEQAHVGTLARNMALIDKQWTHLQNVQQADYRTPAEHPDLDPTHEARLLTALFTKLQRSDQASEKGQDFMHRLGDAQRNALTIQELLKEIAGEQQRELRSKLGSTYSRMQNACTACHATYRD